MARKKETRKKRTNTVSYFDYSLLAVGQHALF